MIDLSQSVVVPRSPAEVFAHLERPEHYGAWLPGIRSVKVASGDTLGVGTPLAFEFDGPSGKPIAATGTVTEFVAPERIGLKASARELRFTASFTLAPVEAEATSTTVTLAVRLELLGFYRFGEGMVKSRAPGELAAALERLRGEMDAT